MQFPFRKINPPQRIPKPKERKCKVRIKRNSDGSITKEVSGCTKEELKALNEMDGKDDNIVERENFT